MQQKREKGLIVTKQHENCVTVCYYRQNPEADIHEIDRATRIAYHKNVSVTINLCSSTLIAFIFTGCSDTIKKIYELYRCI